MTLGGPRAGATRLALASTKATRRRLAASLAGLALCSAPVRASAGDPRLREFTVETPHFRVHYHSGLEDLAQRTASLAETIRARLIEPLAPPPGGIVHIRLADPTDSANGSATALPYNAIRLFVTAPEEMSVLGDYDDWMLSLITHEQTHVFHVDNITGPPVLVNAILGKTYAPNQVQPRWILEGLAVAMESRLTTGGRLRSSLFDMYLRADVLEDRIAPLDQMSHGVRQWPGGDVWYLYGGKFIGWILDTYGPDTFAAVAKDYGANLFPWGINRSIRRATGRTYTELYDGWVKSLHERYSAQVARVRRRGLREGVRLTHGGRIASNPRFVPPCARESEHEEILYHRDDGHEPEGLYRLPLASRSIALEDDRTRVARTWGSPRSASFDGQCGIVFDSVAPSEHGYSFDDLHHLAHGTTSPLGLRGTRDRLTTGARARSPDVSPDGRHVVFVTNHAGTTTLRIADVRAEGGLVHRRALVPSARYEQAFSPRFSPDGKRVAYGAWTAGGYRDIRVVDVGTGRFFEVSHDRAQDAQPSWTHDGRFIVFSSDRTGIANVYAYEVATGRLQQVTNVLTGAYMPEVSPDGRTLIYVGYTSEGFDLFSMPFAEGAFLTALPAPDDRPEPLPEPPRTLWPVVPYEPWATLRPHAYEVDYGTGTFGDAVSFRTRGGDIAGDHVISGLLTYHREIDSFTGAFGYAYGGLPFRFSASLFRSLASRQPLVIDSRRYPVREQIVGVTTAISFSRPGEFDDQGVSFAYTASAQNSDFPIGKAIDPYADAIDRPRDTFLGSVRAAWSYSNASRSGYAVSGERGFSVNLGTDFAGPATGSDATLFAFSGHAVGYLLAPWASHHAFALALSGGAAAGSYPSRGFYFTGGYVDSDPYDAIITGLRQGAFVLRGFPPGAFVGRQYNLGNLEYRFPIAWLDRGVSTLPVFARGLSGALFADYGGAYDELDLDDPLGQYHLGVGGELRTYFTVGYFLSTTLRFGLAKGFGEGAFPGWQTYLVAAATF